MMQNEFTSLLRIEGTETPENLLERAKKVLDVCKEVRDGSQMLFAQPDGLNARSMPAEARVDFLYLPTYEAAAFLISCKMCLGVRFSTEADPAGKFAGVLLACTGRNMHGHGYEALDGLVDALEILLKSPLKSFLLKNGDEYHEFAECVKVALGTLYGIAGGTETSPWGKNNVLVARAKHLVSDWENS